MGPAALLILAPVLPTLARAGFQQVRSTNASCFLQVSRLSNAECTGLSDGFSDCAQRMKDRVDYCSDEVRGCDFSCCMSMRTTTVAKQSTTIPAACEDLFDTILDCGTRIQDNVDDGQDYCTQNDDGCALSCCLVTSTTQTSTMLAACDGLSDMVSDCQTRITDRAGDGLDYCAVEDDCAQACCLWNSTTTTTAPPATCSELSDLFPDCETRIQDRFQDGQNYCAEDAGGCELSCCMLTTANVYIQFGEGACRRNSPTDNPDSSYRRLQGFSGNLTSCQELCNMDATCKAVEFRVNDTRHCELHTVEPQNTSGNASWMCLKKTATELASQP